MGLIAERPGAEELGAAAVAWLVEPWATSPLRAERDRLPWRAATDPWHVLVSEVMLSQTQVGRVADRYREFVGRFPTPAALADAPLGDVLSAWSGLGYNRRAQRLQLCAEVVVERHGGRVPDQLGDLLELPGVGPYIARAVLAFGFGRDVVPVDTNVGRVLARAVAGRRLTAAEGQALADSLVLPGDGGHVGLALMDLGAARCRSRRPDCAGCPLGEVGRCVWQAAGWPEPDPAVGSAGGPGRQSRFEGSDRQGRGRLLRLACRAPIPPAELAAAAGWPDEPDRAEQVAALLVAEGLLVRGPGGELAVP